MARPKATPESRKESYGTPARPLSDWEALNERWLASEPVREACNDTFTRFEKHAYAQPATQREAEGRALTELIWADMRAAGYEVETEPVHFSRAVARTPLAPPPEPTSRPSMASTSASASGGVRPTQWVAAAVAVIVAILVLRSMRRRRG
jgi:hypothetical protein